MTDSCCGSERHLAWCWSCDGGGRLVVAVEMVMMGKFGDAHAAGVVCNFTTCDCHAVMHFCYRNAVGEAGVSSQLGRREGPPGCAAMRVHIP